MIMTMLMFKPRPETHLTLQRANTRIDCSLTGDSLFLRSIRAQSPVDNPTRGSGMTIIKKASGCAGQDAYQTETLSQPPSSLSSSESLPSHWHHETKPKGATVPLLAVLGHWHVT